MGKILDALATGKIEVEPYELIEGTQISEASDDVQLFKHEFIKLLSDEQKKSFEMFINILDIYNELNLTEKFAYGYRIGALTMIEVFTEQNKLIADRTLKI